MQTGNNKPDKRYERVKLWVKRIGNDLCQRAIIVIIVKKKLIKLLSFGSVGTFFVVLSILFYTTTTYRVVYTVGSVILSFGSSLWSRLKYLSNIKVKVFYLSSEIFQHLLVQLAHNSVHILMASR